MKRGFVIWGLAALFAAGTLGCKADKEPAPAPAKKALQDFFNSDKVGLSGELKGLEWGSSFEAVKAALGDTVAWDGEGQTYSHSVVYDVDIPGYEDPLSATLEFGAGGLFKVSVDVPADQAGGLFESWGEAQELALGLMGDTEKVYFADGLRARLKKTFDEATLRLEMGPVASYAEIVGPKGLFPPAEVLGKTSAELLKAFPKFVRRPDKDSASAKQAEQMMKGLKEDLKVKGIDVAAPKEDLDVQLPATRYADGGTLVVLHFEKDGTVRSYSVMVDFAKGSPAKDEILAALKKTWGDPEDVNFLLGPQPTFYQPEPGLRVSVQAREAQVDLSVTTYQTLESFLGKEKGKLGVETMPIAGATIEDLKKAYPQIKVDKGGKMASIDFERTDYEDDVGSTRVLLFIEDGACRKLTFSLGYEKTPKAKARILAAMKAKWGEPKDAPKDFLKRKIYNEDPKVLVRDSTITKAFDIEISPK